MSRRSDISNRDVEDGMHEAVALTKWAHQVAQDHGLGPRGSDVLHAYRIVLEQRRARALERIAAAAEARLVSGAGNDHPEPPPLPPDIDYELAQQAWTDSDG